MTARHPSTKLTIRPYERRDRSAARALAFYNFHVHSHLDWQTTDDYLHSEPEMLWVAYHHDTLVGVMGVSDILAGTCWIRLAAAEDANDPKMILGEIWHWICMALKEKGVHLVAILVLRGWLQDFIQPLGFQYLEDIVTLRRYGQMEPAPPRVHPQIRVFEREDLDQVIAIDHAAFKPPWQMSSREMYQALRIGAYNTVAIQDGKVVAYQVATTHGLNGHLARLAVSPDQQGRGVGSAILEDMIGWFGTRRVNNITVNTQQSNVRSQHLYERFGFQRNGYDLPVWLIRI